MKKGGKGLSGKSEKIRVVVEGASFSVRKKYLSCRAIKIWHLFAVVGYRGGIEEALAALGGKIAFGREIVLS